MQVVPSFRFIDREISKGLDGLARQFGKKLDDTLPAGFSQAAQRAARTVAPDMNRTGAGLAGTFATAFHKRVEAAFRALPEVELTADSSDADRAVQALRDELARLHDKRIGVDIDEVAAMAGMLRLKALLQEITDSNTSVELNADTDRARRELLGFFSDVKTEGQQAADAAAKAAVDAARRAAEKAAGEQQADARRRAQQAAADAARDAERIAKAAADAFARTFSGQTQTAVRNAMQRLPVLDIRADSTDAELAIAGIRGQLATLAGRRVGIDIDETTALAAIAHLREQLQELSRADADVRFRFDAAAGAAELAAVAEMVEHLDGQDAHVEIEVDADRGLRSLAGLGDATQVNLGRLGLLIATGASLGTAIVPAAAAATTAIGFIGTAAAASTIAVGVLALGFSGIGDAVSALMKADDAAGSSAASLSRAQSQVAGAVDAVATAERGLAAVRASNAEAQRRAARDLEEAEINLARALLVHKRALQDLTEAREEARRQARRELEDLSLAIEENALRQRQATLDVADAKAALDRLMANPLATKEEREQARITYEQALLQQKQLGVQQNRLAEERKAAAKAQVDSSDRVRAAQERVADSANRVAAAQRGVADAVAAQTSQQRQAANALAGAQQQLISSQRALARAYTSAGVAGGDAISNVETAMGKLSPTGREFAKFVFGLRDEFYQLRSAASDGLLSGLQTAITAMLPALPRVITFVGRVSDALGSLARKAVDELKDPTWRRLFSYIESTAVPTIEQLFTAGSNIARGMAGLFLAFTPLTGEVSDGLLDITQKFADWATTLDTNQGFQRFLTYARENAPPVLDMLKQLAITGIRFVEAAAPIGSAVVDGFAMLFEWINKIPIDVLEVLVGAIAGAAAGLAVLAAVTSAISLGWAGAIVAGVAAIAAGVVALYQSVEPFRTLVDQVVQLYADRLTRLWQQILAPTFTAIGDAAAFLWTNYLYPLSQVFATQFVIIGQAVSGFWSTIGRPIFSAISWWITKIIGPALSWLYSAIVKPAFEAIGVAFKVAGAAFQVLAGIVQIGAKALAFVFGQLWTVAVKPVWDRIRPFFDYLRDVIAVHVAPRFKQGLAVLATAFALLANAAKEPIRFVVQTVLNDGLLKGYNTLAKAFHVKPDDVKISLPDSWNNKLPPVKFADGGILPGYTPGRDVHRFVSASGGLLDLSGGEAILRPEGTAALGAGWVDGVNRAARTGGVAGVEEYLAARATATGPNNRGVGDGFGDLLGKVRKQAGDALTGLKDVLTDPAGVLRRVTFDLLNLVPGRTSMIGRAVTAVPARLLDAVVDRVKQLFTGDGPHGSSRGGIGAAAMMRILHGPFPDLPLISGYRPGAITVTGNRSYHGMDAANGEHGRAVDVPPLMRVFDWIHHAFPDSRELIFTPAVKRQIHNGEPHVYSGAVAANHYNHVHWALRDGGILPALYDNGGYLPPGLSVVANGTGRPEPVLTDSQWKQLSAGYQHAEARNGAQYLFQFRDSTLTPARLRALQDREDSLNRVYRSR
ncbi:hypothetical protein [Actinoplanes sp. NPDC026623]|uniref:hypothetical protein n=1 Tax=Actinoplanes sp. NPDC026623 TaxID=3155610 RepID=UPI003402DD33